MAYRISPYWYINLCLSDFFPFGERNDDARLIRAIDRTDGPFNLSVPLTIYQKKEYQYYVSSYRIWQSPWNREKQVMKFISMVLLQAHYNQCPITYSLHSQNPAHWTCLTGNRGICGMYTWRGGQEIVVELNKSCKTCFALQSSHYTYVRTSL